MASSIRDDDGVVNPSSNPHLTDLVERAIARNPGRRALLRSGLGLATLSMFGIGLSACGSDNDPVADTGSGTTPPAPGTIGFQGVAAASGDVIVVPEGYIAEPLLLWGDPMFAGAPAFRGDASETWQEQELQAGDNHDGMWFYAFTDSNGNPRTDAGLLALNHEYINPEYFYVPGTDADDWLLPFTFDKARKALAAHGVSVVEVRKTDSGRWEYVRDSIYNRRITGYTPMQLTGPVAGDDRLKTDDDPTGTEVLGTLNNCGNGWTPWGTYLTCEENFNGYFGWNGERTATAEEARYGLAKDGFGYRWHTVDPRFDIGATPNEPNRFGWVVEIDPFQPNAKPKKRTALGRFKHENAEMVIAPNGKAVVYSGDDERFEYLYKFVSDGRYDPANPASARDLLDSGTLYVARFDAGNAVGDAAGTGEWIPLVFGQNGLTPANGFASQADVLLYTRRAGDVVGATKMDRPEWVAANRTKEGEVFVTLTNNSRRTEAQIDDANPRAANNWGQILRWNEDGADPTATTFVWDLFLIAGNPNLAEAAKKGSSNITLDNMFNSPDGLQFDTEGRLWIQTDGNFSNTGDYQGMGNNQMLAADPQTGEVRRFLVGPSGCEVTGVTWSPDLTAMFINIQHPGELGNHPNKPAGFDDNTIARNPSAFSRFPNADDATQPGSQPRPRSGTIVIRRADGGVVGT